MPPRASVVRFPLLDSFDSCRLLKKPVRKELLSRSGGKSCKVELSVEPNDCVGVVFSARGVLNQVELPSPRMVSRLIWVYCRHEKLAAAAVSLRLSELTSARERAARRAHAWLVDKFEKWMKKAA